MNTVRNDPHISEEMDLSARNKRFRTHMSDEANWVVTEYRTWFRKWEGARSVFRTVYAFLGSNRTCTAFMVFALHHVFRGACGSVLG
jgi:hypothetical protein